MAKFEIKKASNGFQFYWTLKAPNGEIIAVSEMYNSKPGAENGIRSVQLYAPTASVVDTTASARWF